MSSGCEKNLDEQFSCFRLTLITCKYLLPFITFGSMKDSCRDKLLCIFSIGGMLIEFIRVDNITGTLSTSKTVTKLSD